MFSYNSIKNYYYSHPKLRYFFLELTRSCNLNCSHCGSECDIKASSNEVLDTSYFLNTISEVCSHVKPSDMMFCITGGEPLLRPDWDVICKHIASLGFNWGMTSNGTLIDEKMVERLKDAGMKTIAISIDGLKDSHESLRNTSGCYEKAIHAVHLLKNSNYFKNVGITSVISKLNIHELSDLYQLVLDTGVDSWKITNIEEIGSAREHLDIFLDQNDYIQLYDFIKKVREENTSLEITYGCSHYLPEPYERKVRTNFFFCGAGISIASISAEGDILPCLDVDKRDFVKQGNIKVDSFWQVWEDGYKMFRQNKGLLGSCKDCPKLDVCHGDSWHTWNIEENEPNMCIYKMLESAHQ